MRARWSSASATAMQYLARERQILAGLTHPHIARLLDGGATVPFIARYRKEATGALDDAHVATGTRAATERGVERTTT